MRVFNNIIHIMFLMICGYCFCYYDDLSTLIWVFNAAIWSINAWLSE